MLAEHKADVLKLGVPLRNSLAGHEGPRQGVIPDLVSGRRREVVERNTGRVGQIPKPNWLEVGADVLEDMEG